MGKCHEFGCQIEEGCAHPMEAGHDACSCLECGVVCRGQFPGCPDVWAQGPRQISVAALDASPANGNDQSAVVAEASNGSPPAPRRISLSRTRAAAAAAAAPDLQPNGIAQQRVSEEFEWLREAFHALHEELQGLVDDLTHQQALLAEVIEGRQDDLRMTLVAESLPDMVRETMTESLRNQQEILARPFLEAAQELRTAAEESSQQAEERIQVAAQELRTAAEESTRRSEGRIEALRQDLEALALSLPSAPAPIRRKKAPAHPPKAASTSTQRKRPSRSSLGS